MAAKLTEAQIARAVRAGFMRGGADPERYSALVNDIVADVAEALTALAPEPAQDAPAQPASPARAVAPKRIDAA